MKVYRQLGIDIAKDKFCGVPILVENATSGDKKLELECFQFSVIYKIVLKNN